jgi:hypothetical protein
MANSVLLSTAYLGTIQYYSKLLGYKRIIIENQENFTKQSYRNRCDIYGANGKLSLTIPVKKGRTIKTPINELEIDYTEEWQKNHWRSIESAYRHSPFFEYYADDLLPFYKSEIKYLTEFNNGIQKVILHAMEVYPDIQYTKEYYREVTNSDDFRDTIHPKTRMQKPDNNYSVRKYYQVFADKFGFIENLSILDLLFNMGPETEEILLKSIVNR